MKLLLDTHTILWFAEGSAALSDTARAAIEDPANECYVSHVSAWEVAVKFSLGKLTLQVPYSDLFPGVITANHFGFLLPEFQHFWTLLALPFHHRDPFDRLLVAQAKSEGMTLVSRDLQMQAYGVPVLW